jgi:hypothetical protein
MKQQQVRTHTNDTARGSKALCLFVLTVFVAAHPTYAQHPEWSKNWNVLKRRDVRRSQSPAAVSLSQVSPG